MRILTATRLAPLAAAALLATLPAAPASAEETGVDGDCTGWDVFGADVPSPDVQLWMRLACLSARVECDTGLSACRVGAGVVSTVGGSSCRQPLGPLPLPLWAPCAAVLDGLAAAIDATGCSAATANGDERWEPGTFTRVRQDDDGSLVWSVVLDCGERAGSCSVRLMPDGRTVQGCA